MTIASRCAAPVDDGELAALFAGWERYAHIALGVSGGADSMALMRFVHTWAARQSSPPRLTVLTVDHGLRSASATEAEWVKSEAAALGLAHKTLVWQGAKPKTGIQAKARAARYALMGDFARAQGIAALATAHTTDDQAETLLMRLGRGSGLDGLAGMAAISTAGGIGILRPLLGLTHARLTASLNACGQQWLEDPSNQDERFERVRIRRGLRAAETLGLTGCKLALAARRLRRARDALEEMTAEFLRGALTVHESGFGEIAIAALLGAADEIALRSLQRMVHAFSGRSEPLRMMQLEACHASLRAGARAATLGGCCFAVRRGNLIIAREYGRMDRSAVPIHPGQTLLWDGRFAITLPAADCPPALSLRPLGPDGLAAIKALQGDFGTIPRLAALTLPSLWQDDRLGFAPFTAWQGDAPPGWLTGCRVGTPCA